MIALINVMGEPHAGSGAAFPHAPTSDSRFFCTGHAVKHRKPAARQKVCSCGRDDLLRPIPCVLGRAYAYAPAYGSLKYYGSCCLRRAACVCALYILSSLITVSLCRRRRKRRRRSLTSAMSCGRRQHLRPCSSAARVCGVECPR